MVRILCEEFRKFRVLSKKICSLPFWLVGGVITLTCLCVCILNVCGNVGSSLTAEPIFGFSSNIFHTYLAWFFGRLPSRLFVTCYVNQRMKVHFTQVMAKCQVRRYNRTRQEYNFLCILDAPVRATCSNCSLVSMVRPFFFFS